MFRFTLICCSLLSFILPTVFAAEQKSISAEAFGQLAAIDELTLSPDGKNTASFRNIDGRKSLVIRPLGSKDPEDYTLLSFPDGEFKWFRWVNNERIIFSLVFSANRNNTDTSETRLYAVNSDKSNLINLVKEQWIKVGSNTLRSQKVSQIQDKVVSFLEDDPEHILLELDHYQNYYPDVFKINVNTAERTLVQRAYKRVIGWKADKKGQLRYGHTQAENGSDRLLYRKTENDDWLTIAVADTENNLLPFLFEGFSNAANVIYISMLNRDGRKVFYEYDVDLQKTIKVVAENSKVDITKLLIDKDGEVYGYTYFDEQAHAVHNNKFWKSIHKTLDANFPEQFAEVVSYSTDKKILFIEVSSPQNPGEFYLLNLNEGTLDFYADKFPSVDIDKLSAMNIVSYKARDGLEIPAYLSLPLGKSIKDANLLPTVILPHGGPQARDYWRYDPWVQLLTTRGYAVLQMNYRGSTGYGINYQDLGAQQWGLAMIDDINDGTQWLLKQKIADPKRICIMGWSYGGYAALQAPLKSPGTYKCSIAGAAVSNMHHFLLNAKKYHGYSRYKKYIKDDSVSLDEISPFSHMEKLNLPILMLHGTEDRNVPYEQSEEFNQQYKDKNKNFKFIKLDNEDHYLSQQKSKVVFLTEVEQFLKKNL